MSDSEVTRCQSIIVEEFFENYLDTLRPFGWRRIAFPFGGTPPPARQFLACPPSILWQGVLAGHSWSCRGLLTGSWVR